MSQDSTSAAPESLDRLRLFGLICLPPVAVLLSIITLRLGILVVPLGCMAVAGAIAVMMRTNWATYVFVGLMYVNAPAIAVKFMGVPKFAAAGVFGLLLLPLFYQLVIQKRPLVITRAVPWIFLLVFVQFISSVIAQRMHVSMPVLLTSIVEGLLLFGMITNVVRTPAVLRNIIWTLLIVGAFLGGLSLFQKATNTFDRNYGGFAQKALVERDGKKVVAANPRSVGSIGEKNYYAQFMLFLVPLGVVSAVGEKRRLARYAIVGATFLATIAIGLTASRGAAVGFLALLGCLWYLRVMKPRYVFLLLAMSIVFVATSAGFRDRISSLVGASQVVQTGGDVREVDSSIQGRASEMLAALIVFQRNPVIGVGAGNFPYHFSKHADAIGFQVHGEERLAHCSYLEIAAETGMLGLFAFLAVYFVTATELIKARRATDCPECRGMATAFLLALIAMAVTSLFLSFAYVRYYWLILALAACAARIATEQCRPDTVVRREVGT